jgi:cation/acetate symporter
MDNSERGKQDREGFEAQYIRAQTGIGIDGVSGH